MSLILEPDPFDAVKVDRYGQCRWSHVTKAVTAYQDRIEELEDALQEIAHRHPIMDGVTAIQMRAIARAVLKERTPCRS